MPPATNPVVCYVTDRHSLESARSTPVEQALVQTAARAAAAGVDWIQVREKDLGGRALLLLTADIILRCAPARIVVNDRLDVAVAAHAGGVHLGGEGLPAGAVAGLRGGCMRGDFLVGVSCHSLEEIGAAERVGADYAFFGPVFTTPSKQAYGVPQGTRRLAEAAGAVRIPVIAIGGVTPGNAAACITAGARGVAAIRWFQQADDMTRAVAELRRACLLS